MALHTLVVAEVVHIQQLQQVLAEQAAVVLALLFSSTRAAYEVTNHNVARLTAGIMELDTLLQEYGGADSQHLRQALRADVDRMIKGIWRDDAVATPAMLRPPSQQESVPYRLRQLAPSAQRANAEFLLSGPAPTGACAGTRRCSLAANA